MLYWLNDTNKFKTKPIANQLLRVSGNQSPQKNGLKHKYAFSAS